MKRGLKIGAFFCLLLILCNVSAITIADKPISGAAGLSGRAASQQLAMAINIIGAPTIVIVQPYNETYLRNYSIPLAFINEGGDNFWFSLDNSNNISIPGNTTFNASSGSHVLDLYANDSQGISRKSRLFSVNLAVLQIFYEKYSGAFKGNSTDFLSYTYERIGNITAVLENSKHGKIEFYNLINLTSMSVVDFDNYANISNQIYFNTSGLQAFANKSAKISFYNISINSPIIVLNSRECPASLCQLIDYSGNIFSMNFTNFNQTVFLSISPRISFVEPTELSGDVLNRSYMQANATSLISNLKNITINLYDSFGLIDSRNSGSSSLYANFSDLSNGVYFFNATACNVSNYCSSTETRNATINVTTPLRWSDIIAPQGIFEPENLPLSGTHVNAFSIKFVKLKINSSETLGCSIKLSNGSLMNIESSGMNLFNANYSLNYTLGINDSIVDDPSSGYLPWELKNCSVIYSTPVYSQELHSRIYVHSPSYWQDNEITRAVACEGMPGVYFNNTAKCEFSKDTLFALQMRNGNPVDESCFNSGACSSNDYCNGLFFSRCKTPDYFGGFSALSDDPNGYSAFNVNFASYSTQIAYTRYTNTSGTFKLRILQPLSNKTFSITIYNLTDVSGANIYGLETGNGITSVSNNGDGTFNVARNRLGSGFTGTLDFVFNISFSQILNENRTLKIVLAYGIDTNQGNPSYFNVEFNPVYGLYNCNEAQSTSKTNELNGPCGDNANNAFSYFAGSFANSYDCYNPDCNLFLGATQNNEFGSGKIGLCNYQLEMNCTDQYDNDYSGLTDCHDLGCFHNDSKGCPSNETICNDSMNNDWDYTISSDSINNNGARYGVIGTYPLTDCQDFDCNGSIGGNSGQICNWGYESNCSDGFNNDALQMKDCELTSVSGSTSMPSVSNAEYDCSQYCRQTIISQETGSLCDNNKDDDYDEAVVDGYYTGISNESYGAGLDCRWGGYFGIGSDYNPDEDCNITILSNGKQCQLMREMNCTDSFDNDFDKDASGMPRAGWDANSASYQSYFGIAYSFSADFDDYDCKSNALTPSTESLNANWCFDGVDNDIDAYYFDGINYVSNSSGGIDCQDSDCSGITNPSNPLQGCFAYEYNDSDPLFNDSARCSDSIDNDINGLIDCSDLSCFGKFNACSFGQCKNQENVSWNSCADGMNNDYFDGVDCADSNCIGMLGSMTGALCGSETCNDNFDNNADGQADCQEHAICDDQIGGKINNNNNYCRASESSIQDCFDNFDNDADGKIDCYDESCSAVCNLSTISGTPPVSLPVIASLSLNSVSDAFVSGYTKQTRNGENYVVTMTMTTESTNAQWTLGTASKPFNKAAFNTSTADLTGADAGSFTLTETANGFVLNSNHAHFPTEYTFNFIIKSKAELASSTYELTYSEEKGSKISLNNYIYHEIDENIPPAAQSMQVIPDNGDVGKTVYLRSNISDNNQLGSCIFNIYGAQIFNSESADCKASFNPTIEGIYYINLTPKDYYSNIGSAISEQYNVNILPSPISISLDKTTPFYHNDDLASINAAFNVISSDSLGNCEAVARNSTDEISLGNFAAAGNNCAGNINVSGLNGEYRILVKVTETTENNIIESNFTSLFVCSSLDGLCRYSDFNDDNKPDFCPDFIFANITVVFPPQNSQIAVGTTQTLINISTNEVAACRYSFAKDFNFTDGILFTDTNSLKHSFLLSLSALDYHIYYKCNDTSGNINPSSTEHNFTVLFAPQAPAPSALPAPGGGLVCKNNDECQNIIGKDYKCEQGICILLKEECMDNSDCNLDQYCQAGKCMPAGKPAPEIPVSISKEVSRIIDFVNSKTVIILDVIAFALITLAVINAIFQLLFMEGLWTMLLKMFAYFVGIINIIILKLKKLFKVS